MPTNAFYKPDEEALQALLIQEGQSAAGIILRLAWQLGLMRGEIHALDWSGVDLRQSMVRLPDRSVPIPAQLLSFFSDLTPRASGPVAVGRSGRPLAEPYISRLARQALDSAGQEKVRLIDLRHDFIVRQLEQHDWQYVSQIAGVGAVSLREHFQVHARPRLEGVQPPVGRTPPQIDGERLARLLQTQRFTPAGTLIRLASRAGLAAGEMQYLTWGQVDWKAGTITLPDRTVALSADLRDYLTDLQAYAGARSEYIVVSRRAGKPLEAAYLSKTVRAALVSGGIPNVTLSDLRHDFLHRTLVEEPVLELVRKGGGITRGQVARLLSLTQTQAYYRLSRMTDAGRLVRVGNRYFLPRQTTAPELHAQLILDYLRREGSAVRQDFARLLSVLPRQVYPILQRLVASGRVVFENGRYYPANRK